MWGHLHLLVLSMLASPLLLRVNGHAYMTYPPSRNYLAYLKNPSECWFPHCGQGGGAGKTPSMCGDPFQTPGPIATPFSQRFYGFGTTLTQGQELDIKITVSTNHGGRMRVAVCPLPRDQVTQACFDNPDNWLHRVNADAKYNNKVYWYLNTNNNEFATERFKLPAGVSCDNGCMMQWWWIGEQSCTMRCEDASIDVQGECNYNPLNPPVPTCTNILQTEQFYNCADVIIKSTGGNVVNVATTPFPSPPTPNPPTPVPSPNPPTPNPPTPVPSPQLLALNSPPAPSPPAPILAAAGTCAAGSQICDTCTAKAALNPTAATSYVQACAQCASSVTTPWDCYDCMTSSAIPGVVAGCLSCVQGGYSWQCTQFCSSLASSSHQMQTCKQCLTNPTKLSNFNAYNCQNCIKVANGNDAYSDQCTTCVQQGFDAYACGQCAGKSNALAVSNCFNCLAQPGANPWACYTA